MKATKQFEIPKEEVLQAYKKVKAGKGSAGVDKESIKEFELNLKDNTIR